MDMAKEISKKSTLIDGIAGSSHRDSSNEVLVIEGVDLSSVQMGQCLINYEHKNDQPNQIVGKVLTAKKIFSEKDCENDRELYFWNKSQQPFIYMVGELFDADGHEQAKEAAAILRYDARKRLEDANHKPVMGYSVEGGKLETDKNTGEIKKSLVRKISLTVAPCNKAAVAEIYNPEQKDSKNNKLPFDLDSILKSEDDLYVEELIKKEQGLTKAIPPIPSMGGHVGQTKSGKNIFSHAKPNQYGNLNSQDHTDAMNIHYKTAQDAANPEHPSYSPMKAAHHMNMSKMHMKARDDAEKREQRFATGKKMQADKAIYGGIVKKSQDVAPSQLTGLSALQREQFIGKIKKQASEAYEKLPNKQKLVKSIMDNNPNLLKHQAETLVKMSAYRDMKKAEDKLSKLHKKIKK
jgi:hypothetical protein